MTEPKLCSFVGEKTGQCNSFRYQRHAFCGMHRNRRHHGRDMDKPPKRRGECLIHPEGLRDLVGPKRPLGICRECTKNYRDSWRGWAVRAAAGRRKSTSKKDIKRWTSSNLSVEWLLTQLAIQDYRCYYTGIKLALSNSQRCGYKPSLDRIDCSKGYTTDNVKITSAFWNRLRNDETIEKVLKIWNYPRTKIIHSTVNDPRQLSLLP